MNTGKYIQLFSFICIHICLSVSIYANGDNSLNIPLKIVAKEKLIKPMEGLIIFGGQVQIKYQDTELNCDRAVIFQKDKELYISGNVMIKSHGIMMHCQEAFYQWNTKKGLLKKVRFTNLDKLENLSLINSNNQTKMYLSADELQQNDIGKFTVKKLSVSNCGCENPHWSVKSSEASYIQNKEDGSGTVRSWNNILYAGKLPIFYIPYMWFNTNDNRGDYPWVKLKTGSSSAWGVYGLVKTGFAIRRDTFVYADIDTREKLGMGFGLGYTIDNDTLHSKAHIYGSSESWQDSEKIKDERWRVAMEHKQIINKDWGFQVELNTQSDEDMLYDYFRSESNSSDGNENSLALYRNVKYSYFEVYSEVRPDDWESETEYLPELRYFYLPRQLGWGGIFYQSDTRVGYLRHKEAKDLLIPDYEAARADTYQEINRPFTLFNLFASQVYAGYRGSFYSRSKDSNNQISRAQGAWGGQMTYRSFAVFDYNYKALNINSVRHIIEPSILYDALEDPTTSSDELLHFDSIDELEHNRVVTLRIDNIFQTKHIDAKGKKNVFDLVDWRLERKYFATDRARKIHNYGQALGNFYHQIDIRPTERIRFFNDIEYDSHQGRIEKYSARLKHLSQSKQWNYQIEQRFEHDDHNHIALSLNGKISRIYSGGLVLRQDWDDSDHREYGLSISRNNHCWTIATTIEYNELTNEKKINFDLWPNFFANKSVNHYTLW